MPARIGHLPVHGVTKVIANCVTRNYDGTAVLYGAMSLELNGADGAPVDIDVFGPDHAYLHGLARAIQDFNRQWADDRAALHVVAAE